jgi:hypothetical protein
MIIYLGHLSPNGSSDSPPTTFVFLLLNFWAKKFLQIFNPKILCKNAEVVGGTILHARKYFAVSAGLNRIVSVRNSSITAGRRYLLRLMGCPTACSDFPPPTTFINYPLFVYTTQYNYF